MSSKRVKITFNSLNEGKYTVIGKNAIAETNQRIKVEMKTVVRSFDKKETLSQQEASTLVLNA